MWPLDKTRASLAACICLNMALRWTSCRRSTRGACAQVRDGCPHKDGMLVVGTKHQEGRVDVVGVGGPDHQVGLPSAQVVGDEADSLLCVVAAHAEVEDLGVGESALEYGRPGLLSTHTEAPGEAVSNSEDPTNARPLGRWGHAGHPASDRISLRSDDLGVLQSWWVKDRPRRDLLLVDCVGRLHVLDDHGAHAAAHSEEEKSGPPIACLRSRAQHPTNRGA